MIVKILYYATVIILAISTLVTAASYSKKVDVYLLGVISYYILWIGIPFSIIWTTYCIYTKDITQAWASILFLVVITSMYTFSYVSSAVQKHIALKQKSAWLARTENKQFSSKKLGISFDYISEQEFSGKQVIVEEKDTSVTIELGNDNTFGGEVRVFQKKEGSTLLSHLQNKYAKDFPKCRFMLVQHDGYTYGGYGRNLISNQEFVTMYDDSYDNGCPNIPTYVDVLKTHQTLYVMNKDHPEKYLFIRIPDYPIPTYKPTKENEYPMKWYESIIFD